MSQPGDRILIVGRDPHLRGNLARLVSDLGDVLESEGRGPDLNALRGREIDVVIVDLGTPQNPVGIAGGLRAIEDVADAVPEALLLALSPHGDRAFSVRAAEAGAYGLVTKPVDPEEIRTLVRLAIDRRRIGRDLARLQQEVERRYDLHAIVGASPPMEALKTAIEKIAGGDSHVLIRGEGGSGRELAARAVHFSSSRKRGPFVAVNTSLLPGHLIEAHLFGGDLSAGPAHRHKGRVAQADGGTLFIDEAGALSAGAQARLLRVIETGEIETPSDLDPVRVDLRVAAATVRNLENEVAARRFRKDLLDRLGASRLEVPPLRERRGDVPLLAAHLLSRACAAGGLAKKTFSPAALACLEDYPWPGNVRELKHVVESLVLLVKGAVVGPEDLPPHLKGRAPGSWPPPSIPEEGLLWERQVERFERGLLEQALRLGDGKKSTAAQLLGLNKDQMKYLCRKYGL